MPSSNYDVRFQYANVYFPYCAACHISLLLFLLVYCSSYCCISVLVGVLLSRFCWPLSECFLLLSSLPRKYLNLLRKCSILFFVRSSSAPPIANYYCKCFRFNSISSVGGHVMWFFESVGILSILYHQQCKLFGSNAYFINPRFSHQASTATANAKAVTPTFC